MLGVFQQVESRSERKVADKVKTKVGDPFIKVLWGRPPIILEVLVDLAEEDLPSLWMYCSWVRSALSGNAEARTRLRNECSFLSITVWTL